MLEIRTKEVVFKEVDEKVDANSAFKYAMLYFEMPQVQGRTIEVVGLKKDELTELFESMFGAHVPERIQFDINGSTVNVRAEYGKVYEADQGFSLEIVIDSWYVLMNQLNAYYNAKGEILFYSSSTIERVKQMLKENSFVYCSYDAAKLHDSGRDVFVDATAGWLLEFMVNFLVNKPGVTDGPEETASKEEINAFLESRGF